MPEVTLVEAVNLALARAMEEDANVVVLGEDVGVNGGVFRATVGLQEEFGPDRCIDTPLAESGIVGAAIGMALYGMRPVAEIQFGDYIYPAYDQIVNELAKIRYRHPPAPALVFALPEGGARVMFDEPQSAVTPGQAVVFYDGPRVLGVIALGEDEMRDGPLGVASAANPLSLYLTKLARLGGYLARAKDPPPGNTVMWRGMTRLTDIQLGFILGTQLVGN